jgi:uncharacterized protein (TIGR02646 family)
LRAVDRGSKPPPVELTARNAAGLTELERARTHLNTVLPRGQKRKPFAFQVYKAEEVKRRLEELFHGKCAYCESFYGSQAPVDVEHYRPKGSIEEAPAHPGYWWLAMEWTNLLPSCLDCNRRRKQLTPKVVDNLGVLYDTMLTGKKDSFPIAGIRAAAESTEFSTEQALLLDPTRDDPSQHLAFWFGDDHAAGLVFPKRDGATTPHPLPATEANPVAVARHAAAVGLSVRGAVSIQVYGLNRVRLVQERARLVQRLRFLESLVIDVGNIVQSLDRVHLTEKQEVVLAIRSLRLLQGRVLAEMRGLAAPDAPYSAIAQAYLQDFKSRLGAPAGP